MKMIEINNLGLNELRWQGARKRSSETFKSFPFGGTEHKRGVAIILNQSMGKQPKPSDLNIIQIYAPTSTSSDEDVGKFDEDLG